MNIKLQTLNKKYKDYQYEGQLKDKDKYIAFLKESRNKSKEERNVLWKKYKYPYIDIDGDYRRDRNDHSNFYSDLCLYLNKQEEKLIKQNKMSYELSWKGIIAKNNKTELCLRSDVFGFSAPQVKDKDNRYPYNRYLNANGNEETVATIIWNTRSLGGSFLWPVVNVNGKNESLFNKNRGVKGKNGYGSYIYDRVDLTLFEIKCFYKLLENGKSFDDIKKEMNHDGYILLKDKDAYAIFEWLSHFETFEKYVEFFSFKDFVKDNEIINIVNNSIIKFSHDIKEVPEIPDLSIKEIEFMLFNINNKILKRTKTMADVYRYSQIKIIGLGEETFEFLRFLPSKSELTYGSKICPCVFDGKIDNYIIDMSKKLGSANPVNYIENKKGIKEITDDSGVVITICEDNESINRMPYFLEYSKNNGAISIGVVLINDNNQLKDLNENIKKMREFADTVLILSNGKHTYNTNTKRKNEDLYNFIGIIEELIINFDITDIKDMMHGKKNTYFITCKEEGKYNVLKVKNTISDLMKKATNIAKIKSMIITIEGTNPNLKEYSTIIDNLCKDTCKNASHIYQILKNESLKNSIKVSVIANE